MSVEQGQHPSVQDVANTMMELERTDDIIRAHPWELERKLAAHHPVFASFVVMTTPPGFAPEEIRQEWVGLELPVRSESEKGVPIVAAEALEKLRANGRNAAAKWWYDHFSGKGHEIFLLRAYLTPHKMVRKDWMANIAHLEFDRSCGELRFADEDN